ncbi:MAG: ABC transporter permease [Candidatus Sumerlaeaceae bacterium]|nr:ABC transporter permease [Candidatus Sumerlaeaceae bacterium]
MLSEVRRLFICEMVKVWRTKLPYIGLACSALMALVAKQSVESFAQPGEVTSFTYFISSIILSATLTTPIFATVYAALSIASETSGGTLRTILVRPVTRTHFLVAKAFSSVFYLVLLFVANAVVAAFIAQGYPTRTSFDAMIESPPFLVQMALCFMGILLSLLPQLATIAFAFLVSVLASSGGSAVGIALGLLLTVTAAKQFISIGGYEIRQFVFSTYYDQPMKIALAKIGGMYETWFQESTYYMLGTSLTAIVVCLAVGFYVFLRRDLNV